jgi:thiamine pyrophosphate-dependent acetolactate synthase large subunit-like protein
LIGDGTFNYNPVTAALGASQEHRLPILIVIFNNSGYLSQKSGIPRHYPDGFAVNSKTFVGTSITPNPDYATVARAFDGFGETVEKPGDVRAALQRGLDAARGGRLALVDVRLEPINPGGEVR